MMNDTVKKTAELTPQQLANLIVREIERNNMDGSTSPFVHLRCIGMTNAATLTASQRECVTEACAILKAQPAVLNAHLHDFGAGPAICLELSSPSIGLPLQVPTAPQPKRKAKPRRLVVPFHEVARGRMIYLGTR